MLRIRGEVLSSMKRALIRKIRIYVYIFERMCAPNVTRFLINTNVSLFTKNIYKEQSRLRIDQPFASKTSFQTEIRETLLVGVFACIYIDANKRGRALFKMIYLTEEREREKKMAEGKNSEGKNFER